MDRHSQEITGIKTLEEILGSLRIIKEYISNKNRTTKPALSEEISIPPILIVKQHRKLCQGA